ncbi:MAG: type II secretion system protein [Bacilli bacterium]|nr:type II secretion system protein [Bacilli bacterium]
MNNKAFTLAEVLAVVVILSFLVLIGVFTVESVIRSGTTKAYNAQINEIKLAAENYVKMETLPTWCALSNTGDSCYLTLRFLAYKQYIKLDKNKEFINPKTDETFSLETLIKVEKYANNYLIELIDEANMTTALKSEAVRIKNEICAADANFC